MVFPKLENIYCVAAMCETNIFEENSLTNRTAIDLLMDEHIKWQQNKEG